MALSMGDALAATRIRLDEATATAWTDPEIRGFINEGCAEIARRTESLETTANLAVTSGTQDVAMPTDVLRVHRVEWSSDDAGTLVIPLEIRELFAMDSVWAGASKMTLGTPRYVSFIGFPPALNAHLYPIPNIAGSSLNVFYYSTPLAIELDGSGDSSLLQIPAGWEDLIYEYATQVAQRRDANPAWQDTRQIFEAKLQQMWDMVQFFHNQPGQITADPHGWEPEYPNWY